MFKINFYALIVSSSTDTVLTMRTIFCLIVLGTCSLITWAADGQAAPSPALPVAYHQRFDPIATQQAAHALLSLTLLNTWGESEFRRPGRWAQLKLAKEALKAGDEIRALELFKRASFDKLRCEQANGIACLDPYRSWQPLWKWMSPLITPDNRDNLLRRAEALCNGTLLEGKDSITLGKPGAIDWPSLVASSKTSPGWLDLFHPLLAAFCITGERRFLDTWADYADDWALNHRTGLATIAAADIPDQWAGAAERMLLFFSYLKGVSMVPGGENALSATTYARVMQRLIADYLPIPLGYHRANPQNWTDMCSPVLYQLSLILDEYQCGPILARESQRMIELLAPTRHQPDGSDLDTTVGYSSLYLLSVAPLLEQVKNRRTIPEWMLPAWEKNIWRDHFRIDQWEAKLNEAMLTRTRFIAGHVTANGEWPIGGTRNAHEARAKEILEKVMHTIPGSLSDPVLASLLSLGSGPMNHLPGYLSDQLPYTGGSYLRASWEPGTPYAYMFCSPHPSNGALSICNNNALGIGIGNIDLIDTGEFGTYDPPRTPILVDGQAQNFRADIAEWGHRHAMGVQPWLQAPAWRWHTSARFDLTEGIYAGPYGSSTRPLRDVTHQRLVFLVREAGLWIVLDRLHGHVPHEYSLDWYFPIAPGKDQVFTPNQIVIDQSRASVVTNRADGPNVALWEFSANPLAMTTTERRSDPKNHWRLHDFLRVSSIWKSTGPTTIITVIAPQKTGENTTLVTHAMPVKNGAGFEATTTTGHHLIFQATDGNSAALTADNIHATGDVLLVVINREGFKSGVLLNGTSLTIDNRPVQTLPSQAEFVANANETTITPIHTPIQMVEISPARHAFLDQESITLTCPTPSIEIRYTLDGSIPTLTSPLYEKPITIRKNTTIKARAIRPGLTQIPPTLDCRQASLVSKADFQALQSHPASAVQTVSGLRYELFTGRWQELILRPKSLIPIATGYVPTLLTLPSPTPTGTFAIRFSGFIDVPATGLYTFTAPMESYRPSIFAGYDLHLSIDGVDWYPGTSQHGLGKWSIALVKGKHPFTCWYMDFRDGAATRLNRPGLTPLVWAGTIPQLLLSGPTFSDGLCPVDWFCRTP